MLGSVKLRLKSGLVVYALNSEQSGKLNFSRGEIRDVRVNAIDGSEPLRGKQGSVSIPGLTHQSIEESKLVSAHLEENVGSFMWVLDPVALISSLVLPRSFLLMTDSGMRCCSQVYRIYQLTRAVRFMEKLMIAMKDVPVIQQLLERNGALVSIIVTFQILGVFSLWSLLTFLLRLFPSRPVAENY